MQEKALLIVDPKAIPPIGWVLVRPGDAALTRRVKTAGPFWTIIETRGHKKFTRGIWAPAANVAKVKAVLEVERSTEAYAKKRARDVARRERAQTEYVTTFNEEIVRFLRFSSEWLPLARAIATAVAAHATPVGSGTVARTKRIPVEKRAELAVIAWMRHRTTAYDKMQIANVRGRRREVRRQLAAVSRALIERHRQNVPHGIADCPLCAAIVERVSEASRPSPSHRDTGASFP